jgi:hypothetical protein
MPVTPLKDLVFAIPTAQDRAFALVLRAPADRVGPNGFLHHRPFNDSAGVGRLWPVL